MPFYHCFGMVMGNLACGPHGACIVVPREAFDAEATLAAVEAERCTSLYGVPTMFIGLLDAPEPRRVELGVAAHRDHGRLALPGRGHAAGAGGCSCREVTICYGMTETSPVSTQTARTTARNAA